MVLLTITPAALQALQARQQLPGGKDDTHGSEPSLSNPSVGDPISHSQLVDLSQQLQDHGPPSERSSYALETLLKGARIYSPPPPPKAPKTPEYEALMARLRADADRQSYARMLAQDAPETDPDPISFSDVNRQLTLIANVLVSVIACSIAIWVTAWHWAAPARLALSLLGSAAVAAAEVAIYMGYLRRVGEAKQREGATREAKEVLETWVVGGEKKKARGEGLRRRKGRS